MPENALSGMLSGKRRLPKKWIHPLTEYIEVLKTGVPLKVEASTLAEIKEPIFQESKTPRSSNFEREHHQLTEEDVFEMAEKAHKSPPAGLTKSQQLRWHKENTQTLK